MKEDLYGNTAKQTATNCSVGNRENGDSSNSEELLDYQKFATEEVPVERIKEWFSIENDLRADFSNIVGMTELKHKLEKCVQKNGNSLVGKRLKRKSLRSYFFYGLPGCGKTFLIKTFAKEMKNKNPNVRVMSLTGGQIHDMYKGVTEKNIEKAFEVAEAFSACILFIDEIESLCRNRNESYQTSSVQSDTTAFLNSYNKLIDHDADVIFIGATNHPELVDAAMMDRVVRIKVELPDHEALANKFRKEFEDVVSLGSDITFESMADYCINYSYRDVEHLMEIIKDNIEDELVELYPDDESAHDAMVSGSYKFDLERFLKAFNNPMSNPSSKERLLKTLYEWENLDKE